tara:strand:+ start:367 stop:1128 length:762 start_codon:yes stop_codon:yes gene_type:complete
MKNNRWEQSLENLRKREIEIVFEGIERNLGRGLELGAGSGFQSRLLINYLDLLVSTDLNVDRLPQDSSIGNIHYEILDAEKVGEKYNVDSFDFIFSSNLLEHLPNVKKCLEGVHKVMKQDGLVVHIVPSPGWRLLSVILHYPHKAQNLLIRIFRRSAPKRSRGNNLKVTRGVNSKIVDLLIPKAHGVSKNFVIEFFAFSRKRWVSVFESAGFEIIDVKRGPISSGYGFGFEKLKLFLHRFNFTTEYIYYMRRK